MLTASASHDQPEPGPSSLGKHPCLEERLTTVEEDTISLGDDDDDPFSDMFNEIDGMVLNRYNVASMDLNTEAALFRQVPFACVLTETDMLPLHVRYMLALYIASSICNNMSSHSYAQSIACSCSHDWNDARCAGCKGKMADKSFMPGQFWLLDSGASCHFTGDISDFTSYQELTHKHYAKMANGVAEITGVGTILLQCLDSTRDELVVKLTQVLYMLGATAPLISMGKLLLHDYKVTGDKSGISLTGKSNRLWFRPDPEDERGVVFEIRSIPTIRSNFITSVSKVNYDIMHWRFGHPSKDVLRQVQKHTLRFPKIHFPSEDCVCVMTGFSQSVIGSKEG